MNCQHPNTIERTIIGIIYLVCPDCGDMLPKKAGEHPEIYIVTTAAAIAGFEWRDKLIAESRA